MRVRVVMLRHRWRRHRCNKIIVCEEAVDKKAINCFALLGFARSAIYKLLLVSRTSKPLRSFLGRCSTPAWWTSTSERAWSLFTHLYKKYWDSDPCQQLNSGLKSAKAREFLRLEQACYNAYLLGFTYDQSLTEAFQPRKKLLESPKRAWAWVSYYLIRLKAGKILDLSSSSL